MKNSIENHLITTSEALEKIEQIAGAPNKSHTAKAVRYDFLVSAFNSLPEIVETEEDFNDVFDFLETFHEVKNLPHKLIKENKIKIEPAITTNVQ